MFVVLLLAYINALREALIHPTSVSTLASRSLSVGSSIERNIVFGHDQLTEVGIQSRNVMLNTLQVKDR